MYRLLSAVLLFSMMVTMGCSANQTAKDSWKFSKRQYYAYVNTPASLDLDDKGSASSYEVALGEVVIDLDTKLKKFLRKMDNSDASPNEEWVMGMFSQFPWLSGVALVGEEGEVHSRFPTQSPRPFDATALLEEDPKQNMTALRTHVKQEADGPEVYVGKPVYNDGKFRGLIVAHFDPRVLAQSSAGDVSKVAIYCPAGVLWTGSSAASASIGSKDWADILTRRSSGYGGSGSSEFFWTTRYIGNMPIVYAISTSAEPVTTASEGEKGAKASAPVAREEIVIPDENS